MTSRDGGLGTTSRGGHGRVPAGDPRAAEEEGGGARGRASRDGLGDVGAAGQGRRRSEFGEGAGVICWGDGSVSAGWFYQPALTCPRDVRWTR